MTGYPQGAAAFLRALAAADPAALTEWLSAYRLDETGVRWLQEQGLEAYAFYRLRSAGVLGRLRAEVQGALRSAYYGAAGDAELRSRELAQVLQALAAAGVRPILYKGAILAHFAYPDPACRPMGDLDLWVTGEEMPRLLVALGTLGYRQHVKPERPLSWQFHNRNEIQLVGQRPGSGLVEPHWGVFGGEWLQRTAAVDEEAGRARAVPFTAAGQPARALAAEDAVIQLATHLAINHHFSYPWARGLLDIALTARVQAVDWGVVAERAHAWRVGTVTWLVLSLAVALTGLEAQFAVESLAPSPLRRRLLSRFVNRESFLGLRDLSRDPRRFLLQLLLVDRPRDAVRLLWRALWPDDAWLTLRYGTATPGVRWRHVLGAIRGRL